MSFRSSLCYSLVLLFIAAAPVQSRILVSSDYSNYTENVQVEFISDLDPAPDGSYNASYHWNNTSNSEAYAGNDTYLGYGYYEGFNVHGEVGNASMEIPSSHYYTPPSDNSGTTTSNTNSSDSNNDNSPYDTISAGQPEIPVDHYYNAEPPSSSTNTSNATQATAATTNNTSGFYCKVSGMSTGGLIALLSCVGGLVLFGSVWFARRRGTTSTTTTATSPIRTASLGDKDGGDEVHSETQAGHNSDDDSSSHV